MLHGILTVLTRHIALYNGYCNKYERGFQILREFLLLEKRNHMQARVVEKGCFSIAAYHYILNAEVSAEKDSTRDSSYSHIQSRRVTL